MNNIPSWLRNYQDNIPLKTEREYPAKIDRTIADKLKNLPIEKLDYLAESSGVRDHLGVLTPADAWSREQYIEQLSDTSEMTPMQIQRIREYLQIAPNN